MPDGIALLPGSHTHLKPQMKKRSDFPNAMRCICRTPSTAWNLARTPAVIHLCHHTDMLHLPQQACRMHLYWASNRIRDCSTALIMATRMEWQEEFAGEGRSCKLTRRHSITIRRQASQFRCILESCTMPQSAPAFTCLLKGLPFCPLWKVLSCT